MMYLLYNNPVKKFFKELSNNKTPVELLFRSAEAMYEEDQESTFRYQESHSDIHLDIKKFTTNLMALKTEPNEPVFTATYSVLDYTSQHGVQVDSFTGLKYIADTPGGREEVLHTSTTTSSWVFTSNGMNNNDVTHGLTAEEAPKTIQSNIRTIGELLHKQILVFSHSQKIEHYAHSHIKYVVSKVTSTEGIPLMYQIITADINRKTILPNSIYIFASNVQPPENDEKRTDSFEPGEYVNLSYDIPGCSTTALLRSLEAYKGT